MQLPINNQADFIREFKFQATRSSGPGGQHVNKVSSRVELRFNILTSQALNREDKKLLFKKLSKRVSQDGILSIVAQAHRSQLKNKQLTIKLFFDLLTQVFTPIKKRKPTKPSLSAREKRLKAKRLDSEKKSRRKNPTWSD